jgi:hypothetical protein
MTAIRNIKYLLLVCVFLLSSSSCKDVFEDINVQNENQPKTSDLKDQYFAQIKNGYGAWYNASIAASPAIGFANADLIACGTAGWGSGTMWFRPRQALFNGQTPDPVIIINFGAWYNYYSGIPVVTNVLRSLKDPAFKVIVNKKDYSKRIQAHGYLLQAMLYGNIALLYDKAYLFTEDSGSAEDFDYVANTKNYKELIAFSLDRIDKAIKILEQDIDDPDPEEVMPGVTFTKAELIQFASSMGARLLACSPRTPAEASAIDWAKVKNYALNGIKRDFKVRYDEGWRGKVISRDDGMNSFALFDYNWIRVNQKVINMMAPADPAAVFPWPEGTKALGPVSNSPDARFNKYFTYSDVNTWFGQSRTSRPGYGWFIMSEYKYTRYQNVVQTEQGEVDHYLQVENDTYLAEAKLRLGEGGAAELINKSRVGLGHLAAATDSDADLMDKLFYERYVESDFVWLNLGFYDKRRRGELLPGTAYHFPIPADELLQHGQPVYTFGGIGKEM